MRIKRCIKEFFFFPHILLFLKNRGKLEKEVAVWGERLRFQEKGIPLFVHLIVDFKEFRSLFYFRVPIAKKWLRWYTPGMTNLYFRGNSSDIGLGLMIHHGHSTRIGAVIGDNCQIWHNVTIGKSHPGGYSPVLGDNVKVCTGALVLGGVRIGNNSTIAAGAVVVKDVPPNCVVVGNPARIAKKDGEKVNIPL